MSGTVVTSESNRDLEFVKRFLRKCKNLSILILNLTEKNSIFLTFHFANIIAFKTISFFQNQLLFAFLFQEVSKRVDVF